MSQVFCLGWRRWRGERGRGGGHEMWVLRKVLCEGLGGIWVKWERCLKAGLRKGILEESGN